MQSFEIPWGGLGGASLPRRRVGVLHLCLAQLSFSGLLASSAHAEISRDYNILILAHVPSLCAMRDMRPINLSGAADDGARLGTSWRPSQFRIVCNVPFAVRVEGIQHHKAGTQVSPLSRATPAPLEVLLSAAAGLPAERAICTSAVVGEVSSCTLLGRSAARGQHTWRPGSWLRISHLLRETEPTSGPSGEETTERLLNRISVELTARY